MLFDCLRIDLIGADLAEGDSKRDSTHGSHEFLVTAVIKSNRQSKFRIIFREIFRVLDYSYELRLEIVSTTDNPNSHTVFVHLAHIFTEDRFRKSYQVTDFFSISAPIFGTEGVDIKSFYTNLKTRFYRLTERFHSVLMPPRPLQFSRFSPSAIAIHDDGNVFGWLLFPFHNLGLLEWIRMEQSKEKTTGLTKKYKLRHLVV